MSLLAERYPRPTDKMQCQLMRSSSLAPSKSRAAEMDAGNDPDELGVFAAERYFYGDDALWCGRSSSSLSSSAFRTGTLEHDRSVVPTPTAATSSSEASWNSRSGLLPSRNEPPPPPPAAKLLRAAAAPVAEVVPGAESERTGHRRASSSNLRRWLLGVAGCACGGGDGEESVSAEEMEVGSDDVLGVGGKKCNTVASDLSPWTEMVVPEQAFEEPTAVTVRPGSGRWLLGGDEVLAGREAFYADERPRRTKSLDKFRALSDDRGNISSGFTIVAGNAHATPPRAAGGGGGGSPGGAVEEDDAAASELGCAYPPSEASVVWSVVTADGAASGNFSSAASGYYHHHYYFSGSCGEDAAAKGGDRRRRSGIAATTATSLLACMSDKAVDAVGPVHRPEVEPAAVARLGAAGGSRNGRGGGYRHDVMRRRVSR